MNQPLLIVTNAITDHEIARVAMQHGDSVHLLTVNRTTDHDEVSERMARLAFLGKTLGIPVHRQWMATGRLLTEILKLANSLWVSQIIASDEISSQLKRITGQRKRPRRLNTLTQSTGGFAFPQKHPQIAANGIYPIEAYC